VNVPETRGSRVGVDIGGTFTDIVVIDDDGTVRTRKVPSTTDDYARGIAEGLASLAAANGAARIAEVVHGTTVATNAILEHKGARTGLITTEGFRDVLELRRLRIPELYNLLYEKPLPLVERALRREVAERIDAAGGVVRDLDEATVRAEIERLIREEVESIAVCLLNSYANDRHERRIGELVAELAPGISCSLSCEILPEVREYERTSTTVINAYVRPVVERYLRSLLRRLAEDGMDAPVFLMQSNGGILPARTAMLHPVQIVESGPAAGVVSARFAARLAGISNAIAFDMGGTTAKASLIESGQIPITTDFEVGGGLSGQGTNLAGGGYAMKVPVIDISEVGTGGGSIVAVDAGGGLDVGPRSAGAFPGPASYGIGGEAATVTDANVVLGYLNPAGLAGGTVPIHPDLAERAIAEQVAGPLNRTVHEAAWAAHAIANVRMIGAIKTVSSERGYDPRDFVLIAFGGNGPVHAAGVAALLGMSTVLVPPSPGLFSAVGLLMAEHKRTSSLTYFVPFAAVDPAELNARWAALEDAAAAEFAMDGYLREDLAFERSADLRYVGQGFELNVPMTNGPAGTDELDRLAERFHDAHQRTYGHRSPGDPIQFVTLRLTVRDRQREASDGRLAPDLEHSRLVPAGTMRNAYFGERGSIVTPILNRNDLAGGPVSGPFIVEEYDATTIVPPGASGRIDEFGNIVIELRGA
jgi:N-methylhydantoinase A